ncbi:MAG: glycosyltransferase [Xanthomonadaceae bacterium]|nr:glycosyltransferase [Xanthomonadaceae bacterium]
MTRALTVVVPVFNAVEQLDRCLPAVYRSVDRSTRVIVIDDASTDPAIAPLLERNSDWCEVYRNSENRGFVATANIGLQMAGDDDVVLLNSDTVPAGRWLQQIGACAAADHRIASITPWSNNAEIVSLPELCIAAPIPDDPEAWARACEGHAPEWPDLPTAVGFCMYLRRDCVDRIGDFDEAAFGRGYGEENDWCMRAMHAGWRNVLCDTAFVAHEGSASFAPLGLKPDQRSMQRLLAKHPDYLARVQLFIASDPLAGLRRQILAQLDCGE